jgi:hypothetical protein
VIGALHRSGLGRVPGALLACALAWQGAGGSFHLVASPNRMACCAKDHDHKKCFCRFCSHERQTQTPAVETCGGGSGPAALVAVADVFLPPPALPATVQSPSFPADSPRPGPHERSLKVPTPPPLS